MEEFLKNIANCFQKDVLANNQITENGNNMTNDKDNKIRCSNRIKTVNDKFDREIKRIDSLGEDGLKVRLELITEIRNIGSDFSIDQLRHINTIMLLQSSHHDMSIALCKCAKDYNISIPENIESPNQFHKYILEQIKKG